MSAEPWTPDAVALAEDVRRGRRSARELVQEAIDRVEARDGLINSVIHRLWELRRLDEPADGPLAGVPMVVKDLGCQTAGDPYHEGMEVLRSRYWTARQDSVLATRFRQAGLVILGRTNTPELATSYTTEPAAYGPTRNPWSVDRSAGGSSGGSAAAVALGIVPVAHGNDCGGSIRVPASMCGVVGLKPTRGRITLQPHLEDHVAMLSNEGVIARSIRDVAAVLDCISGAVKTDPYPPPVPLGELGTALEASPGRLRIGVRTLVPCDRRPAHRDCTAAVAAAARLLEDMGHDVFEVELPPLDDAAVAMAVTQVFSVWVARALDLWSDRLGTRLEPSDCEPRNRRLIDAGRRVTAPEYVAAIQTLQRQTPAMLAHWESELDVLLTPTVAEPPPAIGALGADEGSELGRFASPFNVTGQPALSVPLAMGEDGLPIGVQLVGDLGREDLLLRLGRQLELARPWSARRPP